MEAAVLEVGTEATIIEEEEEEHFLEELVLLSKTRKHLVKRKKMKNENPKLMRGLGNASSLV